MHAEPDRDFFLVTAMTWAELRAASPPGSRAYAVATAVSREAAVCHLLFRAGKTAEVLARLRTVCREVIGVRVTDGPQGEPPDAARTLGTAGDLFHRLRLAAGQAPRSGAA